MIKASWTNGKRVITGQYMYLWSRDRFLVQIDGCDSLTGLRRQAFEVSGDGPDFGKWTLVRTVGTSSAVSKQ